MNFLLAPPVLWLSILGHHFPTPADSLLTPLGLLPFVLGCPSMGQLLCPLPILIPMTCHLPNRCLLTLHRLQHPHAGSLQCYPPQSPTPWIVQQGKEREGEEAVSHFLFFSKWRNRGLERPRYQPEVRQLISGRDGIWTQEISLQSSCSGLLCCGLFTGCPWHHCCLSWLSSSPVSLNCAIGVISFHKWENWELENLSTLPKAMQPGSSLDLTLCLLDSRLMRVITVPEGPEGRQLTLTFNSCLIPGISDSRQGPCLTFGGLLAHSQLTKAVWLRSKYMQFESLPLTCCVTLGKPPNLWVDTIMALFWVAMRNQWESRSFAWYRAWPRVGFQ